MVNSRLGRSEAPGVRGLQLESQALPETRDGDVWQPRTPLALVQPEAVEAVVEVLRERSRGAVNVTEQEHSDRPRLPVAPSGKAQLDAPGRTHCAPLRSGERPDLRSREAAEEGERDMELLAPDDAEPGDLQLALLPCDDPVEHGVRQAEGTEHTNPLIPHEGTRRDHTES